jgi:hypothetical protein
MNDIESDPVEEARRVLRAADAAALPLRAIGGVAVALIAPSIRILRPVRTYHDIDLVTVAPTAKVSSLLEQLGYEASRRFNKLNGSERLLFHDPHGRRVDMFVGSLRMCHALSFATRITTSAWTLSPADLVLSKLQIVELTERDAQDLAALLADHGLSRTDADGIATDRIAAVCGTDWGWWRTVDDNLARLIERWQTERLSADPETANLVGLAVTRAVAIRSILDGAPRSMAWRLRSMIGPRLRWYDQPEEVR